MSGLDKMPTDDTAKIAFDDAGVVCLTAVVDADVCSAIASEIDGRRAGMRVSEPSVQMHALISPDGALGRIASSLGGSEARPVRILAFDKTPEKNWSLGWHQDRVITVRDRVEVAGFKNWTQKSGVPHVEPPLAVLRAMFSLRLHVDPCGADNGALKVVPASWQLGVVPGGDVARRVDEGDEMVCAADTGDVVAMRALTLHASDATVVATRRRVLHVDYAVCDLPAELAWSLELSEVCDQ